MERTAPDDGGPTKVRAAQYVRMSTDHQQYSTDNQRDAIAQYAEAAGYEVVATYADAGRSGLDLKGRAGLQRLLSDVESGHADFEVILIYDVSRWGRFQNIDESIFYEFRCHLAGVRIEYCAERFTNDGSVGSKLLRMLSSVGAADHSRILSDKVHAGQRRLIGMGYRQGGPAGFGLRRLLIDQHGQPKGVLSRNEHKSLQTDRVILVPGPADEVEVVRSMYRDFVEHGRSEAEIALSLNARGILSDLGRSWTRGTIHQVLINEKYIGHNVWNRQSSKLKRERVRNAPEHWIRADSAFEAIVDHELFGRAQALIQARSARMTDQEMLSLLERLFRRRGSLSGLIIDETAGCPSSSVYQSRFGSLIAAYKLVGYTPERDYRYIEINKRLRAMHPDVIKTTAEGISALGASAEAHTPTGLLLINREFTVSLVIVRCLTTPAGSLRWQVRLDRGLDPDITVAIRMNPDNRSVRDYLILPTSEITGDAMRIAESNGIALDAFLFETLDPLFNLAERIPVKEVVR